MKTAVIIARFQTPYLHSGHTELIQSVKANHNKLIIILGIAPIAGSKRNPYDYYTREKMIKASYPEVIVLPLSDHPDDNVWSQNLDTLLKNTFTTEGFILYGSRDSFISYYSGKYETAELPQHGDYNSTDIRKQYADRVTNSEDFRAGILYAYHNQYTKVYPTVDVAVFRNNRTEILLGQKVINKKWRLIGGFADAEDSSFEEAAKRELTEECGSIEVGNLKYETSLKINDWRYRNEADKIITTLFSCDHQSGNPTPLDDIEHLEWIKVNDLFQMIKDKTITEEHIALFQFLLKK
ncbi:NUDIX domain-containing protein [Marivirga tractuosa]|uniref:NUDIX domain-containing protein n=1 Tax=Marivirga tractuosa TaxID=1006 RepID=UPI0035D0561D